MRIPDFLEKVIEVTGRWYDKFYLHASIVVLSVAFLAVIAFVIIISVSIQESAKLPENISLVIEQAQGFCESKGYASWHFLNETNNTNGKFICINSTKKINLTELYVP